MKTIYSILLLVFCAGTSLAQISPQSKKITNLFFQDLDSLQNHTPALQKKRGFTNYEELIDFLNQLKAKQPDWVTIKYIGESQNGLAIPLVRINTGGDKIDKVRVFMQGGLHGNEPASTEGVLYFLYRILNKPSYLPYLEKTDLMIIPMANIDGYLKNQRNSANGLDLNRDQTKLMAPESIPLKQAFSDFAPEVALDFHEYNAYRRHFRKMSSFGITSLFDVMFLYSGNLNVPENLRKMTDTLFVEATRKNLSNHDLNYYDYISTREELGNISFNKGSVNSRSSATSYALTNCISSIIEVRGVRLNKTSFKRRVFTTFLVAESFFKTAVENKDVLREEIKKAQQTSTEITVLSERKRYLDTLQVIDLDTKKVIGLEATINDALQSKPQLTRKRPDYYVIEATQEDLIKKLNVLGLEATQLEQDTSYKVEAMTVKAYKRSDFPYEEMYLQTVETELEEKQMTFPKGTYLISTDQKNTAMLTETLEPEAPNSFVSFGVIETSLNNTLPIYRLFTKK